VIQRAVHEIDGGLVGGTLSMPLQSQPVFDAACAATASMAPAQLQQRLVERLALVDAYALIAELRAYTNPPRETHRVLRGVLCLLGRRRKALTRWEDLKRELTVGLVADLRNATAQPLERLRWRECHLAVKGMKLSDVLLAASCPLPVKVLLKWLMAVRLVSDLAAACEASTAQVMCDAVKARPEPEDQTPTGCAKGALKLRPAVSTPVLAFSPDATEEHLEVSKEGGLQILDFEA